MRDCGGTSKRQACDAVWCLCRPSTWQRWRARRCAKMAIFPGKQACDAVWYLRRPSPGQHLAALAGQAVREDGHLLAERGGRGGLPMRARQHSHVRMLLCQRRHRLDHLHTQFANCGARIATSACSSASAATASITCTRNVNWHEAACPSLQLSVVAMPWPHAPAQRAMDTRY